MSRRFNYEVVSQNETILAPSYAPDIRINYLRKAHHQWIQRPGERYSSQQKETSTFL